MIFDLLRNPVIYEVERELRRGKLGYPLKAVLHKALIIAKAVGVGKSRGIGFG